MKTYTPSNETNLKQAILWQYEKAERLKALIQNQQTFFEDSTTAFWNDFRDTISTLSPWSSVTVVNSFEPEFDGTYVFDSTLKKWVNGLFAIYKSGGWYMTGNGKTYTAPDNGLNIPPATFVRTLDYPLTITVSNTVGFNGDYTFFNLGTDGKPQYQLGVSGTVVLSSSRLSTPAWDIEVGLPPNLLASDGSGDLPDKTGWTGSPNNPILAYTIEESATVTPAGASPFCLSMWGIILGVQRPFYISAFPTITDAAYWMGSKLIISGSGEGDGVYTFTVMQGGKPRWDFGTYVVYFDTDRFLVYKNSASTDIYQQTVANAWPWEGTWEVIAGQEASAPAPATPSSKLESDGTAHWTGMQVSVTRAGHTDANGDYTFIDWKDEMPRFHLTGTAYYLYQYDVATPDAWIIWHGVAGGIILYKTTGIDSNGWPWEDSWVAVNGSTPVPVVANPFAETFSDAMYSRLLWARVLLMRMNGSMKDINRYMNILFSGKPVSVVDNFNMTISYLFNYTMTAEEEALIAIDGVLPRPAGVLAIIGEPPPESIVFGFSGQQLGQFDRSSFAPES